MNKETNVLVYPSGGENGLEIHNALSTVVNINIWGTTSRLDHSPYVYKNFISSAPAVYDSDFVMRMNEIIESHNINVIIPAHDTVAMRLAELKEQLKCEVAVSSAKTARIRRKKSETYLALKGAAYLPKNFTNKKNKKFPVFIKPDIGEGSRNSHIVQSAEELSRILSNSNNCQVLVLEYLPGEEYTVDCFTDRKGQLQFVGPRTRDRVFSGISVRSKSINKDRFLAIAKDINSKIELKGQWYFQVKEDENKDLKLLEISARAATTANVYRQRGVNLPLLTVYDALGYDVSIMDNEFTVELERCLHSKYKIDVEYSNVYLDFDDTLIVNGEINITALQFVYQCFYNNKKVHLITKHEFDLKSSMREHHLSESLFTSIIHLNSEEQKFTFIQNSNSIFIDNAYAERKEVFEKIGIPVFDVDAIESLIDWRK